LHSLTYLLKQFSKTLQHFYHTAHYPKHYLQLTVLDTQVSANNCNGNNGVTKHISKQTTEHGHHR